MPFPDDALSTDALLAELVLLGMAITRSLARRDAVVALAHLSACERHITTIKARVHAIAAADEVAS